MHDKNVWVMYPALTICDARSTSMLSSRIVDALSLPVEDIGN